MKEDGSVAAAAASGPIRYRLGPRWSVRSLINGQWPCLSAACVLLLTIRWTGRGTPLDHTHTEEGESLKTRNAQQTWRPNADWQGHTQRGHECLGLPIAAAADASSASEVTTVCRYI